jgi:hypothetical protein
VIFPKALVRRSEIEQRIDFIRAELSPDIVSLEYRLGEDWSEDAAIFFHVVIADRVAQPDFLHRVTREFRDLVEKKLDSLSSWGAISYFSFRTESDNRRLNNEGWG